MPITFTVTPKRNPQKPNDPQKYYASIVGDGKTTLSDLAKHASTVSTVSKADILAVLESTFEKIVEQYEERIAEMKSNIKELKQEISFLKSK